jgi:hypothetical protein
LTKQGGEATSDDRPLRFLEIRMLYPRSIVAFGLAMSGPVTFGLVTFGLLVLAASASAQLRERNPTDIPASLERCAGIADASARIQCYQRALGQPASPGAVPPKPADGWRLVRSRDPRGGPDAVSMMRTADTAVSDLELAGVLLRCGEQSPEMRIVVLTPFPPRARPEVTIAVGTRELRFDATVVPPGAELLLPPEVLADAQLRSAREISIRINTGGTAIKGTVVIEGLNAALATLSANCAAR